MPCADASDVPSPPESADASGSCAAGDRPDAFPAPGPSVEPVTPEPPDRTGRTLLSQSWLDVTFLHWPADPARVAALLPDGARPDLYDGAAYVGLIAFRMHRIGWLGGPGIPYLGSFAETNVRLYSVDRLGRRGVVFRSLDADRLAPVLAARWGFRLPYQWSRMSVRRAGTDELRYTGRRRWPDAAGAHSEIRVRVGAPIAEPSGLEHFLTARWGLHNRAFGRRIYLPNEHAPWPLHQAELVHCDEDLVRAAGLPDPVGPPVSVLFSPGVKVRFGRPLAPPPPDLPDRSAR